MAKSSPSPAPVLLNSFLSQPDRRSSRVLNAGAEILDSIDQFLRAYSSGQTRKTMQEFHRFLATECSAKFSCDTLKRYCQKFKPELWKSYKEVRDGRKIS